MVSVIVPVFHDVEALLRLLDGTDWAGAELIVAAAAGDASIGPVRARRPDVIWTESDRGRANQMNAGAAVAHRRWLLFLHADTQLPPGWPSAIDAAERDPRIAAGCFRFALDSPSPAARLIERGVRLRVDWLGLPYGDQGLFVRRDIFRVIGGYADLPIMEDVDLVRRLRARGRLFRSALPAVTSARTWERDGWLRRTARHLALISLYFAGIPPDRLIRLDRARATHPDTPARRMSL
jgi:rSAM/selenodomain-associated transferase 2